MLVTGKELEAAVHAASRASGLSIRKAQKIVSAIESAVEDERARQAIRHNAREIARDYQQ
jgi:hypothetical protein